ncbi:hypothetical protein OG735_13355 [Streptomyces sp. NBC_01210]|uniref:hypothetical protein n=1 Tax=Streptomyces sp. NBC_01210 TaxID=2903774 RepID=UPI002E13107A|nr:hypothetical protein OG735_13355 [Streptomyces sp. NBC_01210]
MDNLVTVLAILAMIIAAALAIHLVNGYQDERIAALPFGGRTRPAGRRHARHERRHTAREWLRLHRHAGK